MYTQHELESFAYQFIAISSFTEQCMIIIYINESLIRELFISYTIYIYSREAKGTALDRYTYIDG